MLKEGVGGLTGELEAQEEGEWGYAVFASCVYLLQCVYSFQYTLFVKLGKRAYLCYQTFSNGWKLCVWSLHES